MADQTDISFTVGPHTWLVHFVPFGLLEDSGHLGSTTPDALVIGVDGELPPSKRQVTLMHEVLHACSEGTMLDNDQEEALIRIIAPNLIDALQSSPRLRAELGLDDERF